MFIVYSPEGQSFIGASQKIPPLKIDPLKRSNPLEDDVTEGFNLNVDQGGSQSKSSSGYAAIHAYKAAQKKSTRRVVVKVAEIMSAPVKVISDENSIEEAWQLMQASHIQHLPVIRAGELVGICSQRDLLNRVIVSKDGLLEGAKREHVFDVMQTQVVTTTEETDIRHVANVLIQYDIGALVIMNPYETPVGIVTRGDIIKRLGNEPPLELYV
jgi:acetoin utilization protein AcuB